MFSKTYLKQPAGTKQDSERLRNRLAAKFPRNDVTTAKFVQLLEQETGVRVPRGIATWDIAAFFRDAELRDVLDGVTCVAAVLGLLGAQTRP